MRAVVFAALLLGCSGSPGGPSMNNRMSDGQEVASGPAIQSNDILAREAQANRTMVKHVLIGWKDLDDPDPRAARRTRAEADALAQSILERVRKGEEIEALMAEYSEDPGSAESGQSYEVTPSAGLVFEFTRLGLRLKPGEAGMVLTRFGWHVMQRVE
jgi:peptidyl-prolyl cis-trans isomerase D